MTTINLIIYLATPFLIAALFQRYKWVRQVGTVIIAYAVGILMSLTGMVSFPEGSEAAASMAKWQTLIMNVSVPLAIPLMLFSCDFRLWTKSLPKTVLALAGGLIAVLVAVVSAYFIFRRVDIPGVDNFGNVVGMFTGIYTGGTMNFNALGLALHVNPTIITTVLTFEMLVTFPYIVFIVAGGYRLFRKALPYAPADAQVSHTKVDVKDIENYSGIINRRVFPKTMLGVLLSVGFLAVGAGLSLLLTGGLNELVVILTITTLGIAASFSEKVRNLPKTFEAGMILILMFSIVVASQFNFYSLTSSVLPLMLFVLYVMVVAVVCHLLLCRFFRVEGDLFTVANIGLLCSPPFIPPVVGAMGNKRVLISGIAIGLAGYAIGTYMGVAVAYILNLF